MNQPNRRQHGERFIYSLLFLFQVKCGVLNILHGEYLTKRNEKAKQYTTWMLHNFTF